MNQPNSSNDTLSVSQLSELRNALRKLDDQLYNKWLKLSQTQQLTPNLNNEINLQRDRIDHQIKDLTQKIFSQIKISISAPRQQLIDSVNQAQSAISQLQDINNAIEGSAIVVDIVAATISGNLLTLPQHLSRLNSWLQTNTV